MKTVTRFIAGLLLMVVLVVLYALTDWVIENHLVMVSIIIVGFYAFVATVFVVGFGGGPALADKTMKNQLDNQNGN